MDIRLRAIEEADLPQLLRWRNDDQPRHTFREYRLLNMINQRDWLDHISRSREVEMFGIELAFEGGVSTVGHSITVTVGGWQLIGICGLCNINWVNRTAEVSLYIARQYQGVVPPALGLLRQKAFGEFNLHRLWTETYDFRVGRIAILEHCGYAREGAMREHVFKHGKYRDSIIHGMVNNECASNCHGR